MLENISDDMDLVEKIDVHNGHMIDLLSKVYHCFTIGASLDKFEYAIKELADYAPYQFDREEDWMRRTLYAEVFIHNEEHRILTRDIAEMRLRLPYNYGSSTLDQLLTLIKWFTQHILTTDLKYRQFITDNPTVSIRLSEYALFSNLKEPESLIAPDVKETERVRSTLTSGTDEHICTDIPNWFPTMYCDEGAIDILATIKEPQEDTVGNDEQKTS